MTDLQYLPGAGQVRIEPADPAESRARYCLGQYFAELDKRFDAGFDPRQSLPADDDDLRPPSGLLLVATCGPRPVGCGALKLHGKAAAEIKRMWVASSARGMGIGRRVLAELERHAASNGATAVRLETNRTLTEAISLYRSAGYAEVQAFNQEQYAHHWFEKAIGS
jgi:ribosomal protein S18 acetylase RimI-like enzyme